MNNARFGTLANLYHRPRQQMQQPMQGGMQQPQQGPRDFNQAAMGHLMGSMLNIPQQRQRPMQVGQQGGSAMNAIIAQLMNKR